MDKPTCLWTALILCMAFVAALADSVFVDGRPSVPAPAPAAVSTNIVSGSTGITNIWSGNAAAYIAETNTPPGKGADIRTLYLIEE